MTEEKDSIEYIEGQMEKVPKSLEEALDMLPPETRDALEASHKGGGKLPDPPEDPPDKIEVPEEEPEVGFVRFDEVEDRKKTRGKENHLYTPINELIMAVTAGKVTRRQMRYRIFRIREGGRVAKAYDLGLKGFIEAQFTADMNWENFTYEWDIAPNEVLKVIPKNITNYEWLELGGKFDGADKKIPPAFTHQK